MSIEINTLETNRFGVKAARIRDLSVDLQIIDQIAVKENIEMLTVRVDTNDLDFVHRLEKSGFCLMDTLVYYERSLSATLPALKVVEQEVIRPATVEDASEVAKMAGASFEGYIGHYHADPRLSDKAADEAYVEWAKESVRQVSTRMPSYVVEVADEIVAFAACAMREDGESEIILNCVHPNMQGNGIYGRLIENTTHSLKAMGAKKVIVSTQINNIPVQRAWTRRGFRMDHSLYTFHKWYEVIAT